MAFTGGNWRTSERRSDSAGLTSVEHGIAYKPAPAQEGLRQVGYPLRRQVSGGPAKELPSSRRMPAYVQ